MSDDVVNISFGLNCTSQGGPVNKMLWLYENEIIINHTNHFPTLADAKKGLYHNSLYVHGRQIGTYTCRIPDEMNRIISYTEYTVVRKCALILINNCYE